MGYPRWTFRLRIRNVRHVPFRTIPPPVGLMFHRQGYPDRRTVDFWTGADKAERFPQSKTSNSHNKADGFERRLEVCNVGFNQAVCVTPSVAAVLG
jgi:hypothetical protein